MHWSALPCLQNFLQGLFQVNSIWHINCQKFHCMHHSSFWGSQTHTWDLELSNFPWIEGIKSVSQLVHILNTSFDLYIANQVTSVDKHCLLNQMFAYMVSIYLLRFPSTLGYSYVISYPSFLCDSEFSSYTLSLLEVSNHGSETLCCHN